MTICVYVELDGREEVGNSSSNMNNTKEKKGKSSPSSKKNVSLQQKARMNLLESKFRWLNEQLYNKTSTSAFELFKNNSKLFDEGFSSVVESWPKNPVDIFIEYLKQKPKNLIVADLGCGEAKIAKEAPNKILSFDFVAKNDKIIVFIFSLSLMGTNYIEFLKEAHRELKVAEVVSRFTDINSFIKVLTEIGFEFIRKELLNSEILDNLLKPCVYKKR
ncbi:3705_t:CDS:2 [Entrophospora sp. SA101]|nr:3705_t:CDS:2 [Entrophospora sp. SA101]